MTRVLRNLMLLAVLAGASLSVPAVASADDYWDGYWGWYDGSYRPYYSQRSYSPRRSGYYDGGYYGGGYSDGYYGSPYRRGGRGYYNRGYGGNYYGSPNAGYRGYQGGGGQVNVGGLQFGWR